ncbi:inhibitor of growth protein 3 isoform X1 [Bradysia coprophila]|uniref:inhibitor of growth protein 3 isoform X1 n=1 Tax=Bradysia coprophila TaxID=38358 RepID=UPI00187DAB1C|nr:inhibitor of growth protein 3 isoform X1 [Bradysia coprophila]
MLFLEDYLEMIEHLPQELRDRFTEMREMDLSVQNNTDTFEKRIRALFSQCRRGELQGAAADAEFNSIRNDYYKALEDADEKVQLANQTYDLVERYLRKLDSELFKFKLELEADHNGITEILEKRSLELDGSSSTSHLINAISQKENRYFGLLSQNNHSASSRERYRPKPEKRRDSRSDGPPEKRHVISTSSAIAATSALNIRPSTPTIVMPTTPTPSMSYSLQHLGAGNAIVAAASQAIAATQQMQQGRRTASLKASYEAIHGGGSSVSGTHELMVGRELTGAAHSAIQVVERDNSFNGQRRHKKKLSHPTGSINQGSNSGQPFILPTTSSLSQPIIRAEPPPIVLNGEGLIVEQTADGEWTYDPNEPRYCICNQVSYGDMVACDNEACPFEWFHYPCVGITQSPKGKWYCPKCTASMKRRGARK